ncbi:MAG: CRISPR-associated endonuclease Cas1 [Burkholderiaceae bacterium]|nr:CRISPR-associated endonuclease Cas1 [Burkholderiaceae bacterium]
MSTLLLDRAGLEVRRDGNALALYEAGERRGSVPLALLERCVIQGVQTRLDSGVLLALAEAGVTTVLFSPRAGRRVATVLGPAHNDAAVRLAQALRCADAPWCAQWARELVRAKLARQRRVLRQWLAARPDARKPLADALAAVDAALQRLADAAAQPDSAPDAAALRGIEGAAARAHFAGLAAVLPPALGFAGRNRRPPRDPANVCLSLGYSLLHVEAVQACWMRGLDPLLGFYHRPAFGRESLASDLIEPLRAAVDLWAWELLRSRRLREEHFSFDRGACLLGKAGRSIFYAAWAGDVPPLRRWLRLRAAALARQLRGEGLAWVDADPDDEEAVPAGP